MQKKTAFVARNLTFKKNDIVSLKSKSKVGFMDFPDIGGLSLRQNPIETEVWERITVDQTVPSDQTASHENGLQQLKHENESRESNSVAEKSVPQKKKTQNLICSYTLEAHFEPIWNNSWNECLRTAEGSV